jgi:hypothetical protein
VAVVLLAVVPLAIVAFAADPPELPEFHNVGAPAGLDDSFPNGGTDSKKYIIETTGSGAAFIDYNNDGRLDIFLLSGAGGSNRLYRNEGNGHFTDVTKETGLASDGWSQGVCAGISITMVSPTCWSRPGAVWRSIVTSAANGSKM